MRITTKTIELLTPFMLYTDCIPVKGKNRSTICDLTRQNYVFIPNALYDIIAQYEGQCIQDIKTKFDSQYHPIIDDYFDYLLEHEMIFFTDNIHLFPKLKIEKWDEPHTILHCILDFKNEKHYITDKLKNSLENLACQSLQLRFFGKTSISFVKSIIDHFKTSCVENIEIVLPYDSEYDYASYEELTKQNLRINLLIVYASPEDTHKGVLGENAMSQIYYTKKVITDQRNCGCINPQQFSINIKTFTESQKYNTCLNRKISVDSEGNIKNCPSMNTDFGSIINTSLEEALAKKGFKSLWKINKNQIKTCSDCEFRHICTDCRAYLEDPKDKYSKPLKCGYDPYTNQWEKWSANHLKQKAINDYGLQNFI
jgi:SPASM domain peptide maturase of grasp-with-spasm system